MTLWHIYRWPLLIGLLTTTGLITGLASDSWGDAIAALGLLIPASVGLYFWLKPRD